MNDLSYFFDKVGTIATEIRSEIIGITIHDSVGIVKIHAARFESTPKDYM